MRTEILENRENLVNRNGNDFLPLRPHMLISLWEMINLLCAEWLSIDGQIIQWHEICEKAAKSSNRASILGQDDRRKLTEIIQKAMDESKRLELMQFRREFVHTLGLLQEPEKCSHDVFTSELHRLHNAIRAQLLKMKCVLIAAGKEKFFEQDRLFGEKVYTAFPLARDDIKAAGNCIAADLNTAAVYHLMCVIEIGIRDLARLLKVKKVKTHVPIEFGTWDEIIVELEKKTKSIGLTTRGKTRQKRLDFYNELLKEMRLIKDLWRNKVMHSRVSYDFPESQRAFNHVHNFMKNLAEAN